MGELTGWITLLWSAFALLAGVALGAFWGDLRRVQRSDALGRGVQDLRALDSKSDHFSFGIADLEVRIRATDHDIEMMRTKLADRRATYERMNGALCESWDEAVALNERLAAQQRDIDLLQLEIDKWKSKLDDQHKRHGEGALRERALRRELVAGLSAIFDEVGDELPSVQRLLLERTIGADTSGIEGDRNVKDIVALLTARAELLEGQLRYWQDRACADDTERAGALQPPVATSPRGDARIAPRSLPRELTPSEPRSEQLPAAANPARAAVRDPDRLQAQAPRPSSAANGA